MPFITNFFDMKATIIGAGNMGGAIACGLAKGTTLNPEDITCIDPNPAALERLRKMGMPFKLTSDMRKPIAGADILILAVKPHIVEDAIAEFRDLIDYRHQILFSVVAGVTFDQLNHYLFQGVKNIKPIQFRVIPNTAVSIGESMTFIAEQNATMAQIKLAETLFGEMGRTMIVPEKLLPGATAMASCGIAYAMRYVRAAMEGGIEVGFGAVESREIVLQTIKGAIDLLIESGNHPEVEIDRVTTPGGYTIRGLNAMEENGFSNAVIAGIRESCKNNK